MSIGASRWRSIRHAVGESALSTIVAIVIGVGVAIAAFRLLASAVMPRPPSHWRRS